MTTEEKALALALRPLKHVPINSATVRLLQGYVVDMVSEKQAAIEAHEADKKAFSDAAKEALQGLGDGRFLDIPGARKALSPFILPKPEPDPLVEARRQIADRVLRQFGAPASDEDCIGLIVAALEEQAKIERIDDD